MRSNRAVVARLNVQCDCIEECALTTKRHGCPDRIVNECNLLKQLLECLAQICVTLLAPLPLHHNNLARNSSCTWQGVGRIVWKCCTVVR